MAYASYFDGPRNAQADAEHERAKTLINSLAAAEVTYDNLGANLKRALGYERRPMDRNPRLVTTETRIALREARRLVAQLERAAAALPEGRV